MICNHKKCRICKKCHCVDCKKSKPCRVDRESKNMSKYRRNTLRKLTLEEEIEQDKFLVETAVINIFAKENNEKI